MLNNVKTAALLAGLGGLIMAVSAVVGGRSGGDTSAAAAAAV